MEAKLEMVGLRIAMIEPQGHGGISHYSFELCRALSAAGVDVTLYTKDNYELRDYSGNFRVKEGLRVSRLEKLFHRLRHPQNGPDARVNRCGGRRRLRVRDIRYVSSLRTLYMEMELLARFLYRGIRVVHFQWVWPSQHSTRFVRLLRLFGIRVVYTAHNLLPHDDFSMRTKKCTATWYQAVDRVIVHSKANARELIKLFHMDHGKVSVIPHGNYGFFRSFPGERRSARGKLAIAPEKKVILFFGLIRKYKGLENLLEAFRRARRQDGDLFLVIAGKLIPYEGRTADTFREEFTKLGIADSVMFRPDYLPVDLVGTYFAAADVIALPYLKTYQSGIVHLAYSFERPVIATETGGLPEVVRDGKSGFLVPVGDPGEFARAILKIFGMAGLREEMGRYARKLSMTEYSWDAIARRHFALYGEAPHGDANWRLSAGGAKGAGRRSKESPRAAEEEI